MNDLTPTEECIVRSFRKTCQAVEYGWFWIWTTSLIYVNHFREMIFITDTTRACLPVLKNPNISDHLVAATVEFPDNRVELFEESLFKDIDSTTTAGDVLKKANITDTDSVLSVILTDGSTYTYKWDDVLVCKLNTEA